MPLSWIETDRIGINVNILVWRTLWCMLMNLRELLELIIRLSGLRCIYNILSQSALEYQCLRHLLTGLASWLSEQPLYKFLFIVAYIVIINSSEW